jgi:prepilin-type processing-associated H-X9-DG protein
VDLRRNLCYPNGGYAYRGGASATPAGEIYMRVALRHGGSNTGSYADVKKWSKDGGTSVKERANAAFQDGHVEALRHRALLDNPRTWHPLRKPGWVARF